ncbi:MAG: cation-translocating P-type ATPase [Victivallales bacterium]|jgi:Ca2+-transporting ATPase
MGSQESKKLFHALEKEEAVGILSSDISSGLSSEQAEDCLKRYGKNELKETGRRSLMSILWEQLRAVMVLILVFSAILAGVMGSYKDCIAISAIVVLFVLLGVFQDYKAERAIAALKKLSSPLVKLLRNGKIEEISSRLLVPGDIIIIETGNIIPADCRIIESVNLRIQESILTGESHPVDKTDSALHGGDIPIQERLNIAYMGTTVTLGRGKAVVFATGMNTELGKIAELMQQTKNEMTPLQKRLDRVGKVLAVLGFAVAGIVFAIGLVMGNTLAHMALTAISIAVAVIPEGLPALVTITLSIGAQRMLRRNALIRKLPAVETLGSVTVICSDKTGTLTENRMKAVFVDAGGVFLDLASAGSGKDALLYEDKVVSRVSEFMLVLAGGALCNDSGIKGSSNGNYEIIGDPTEGALVVAAARFGIGKDVLEGEFPRISENPFDSERKRMTSIHEFPSASSLRKLVPGLTSNEFPYIAFTKGSVDGLLEISDRYLAGGKIECMSAEQREKILESNNIHAAKGIRVLGLAFQLRNSQYAASKDEPVEKNLIFAGLFGLIDPPRKEAAISVATCREAGIRPIMITGDHPLTAGYIARQLGIETSFVVTGREIDGMTVENLESVLDKASVFARVSPEHKLKIIEALQRKGNIVAMTGDGVNDAPALKKAEIGVSMGITGTDVAKEASDIVLLDDNFSTIVSAVEEGRSIYDNIKKFVKYSVAGNIGKVLVMLVGPFLGNSIPLLPLQLLWLNLLTDGLLGLGLGLEPAEKNIMKRAPCSPKENIFNRAMGIQTAITGTVIGLISLAIGMWYFHCGSPKWQTMIFTILAVAQVFQALASRSLTDSFFKTGLSGNRILLGMIISVIFLQLIAVYVPSVSYFFHTERLSIVDLSVCAAAGVLVLICIEIQKYVLKSKPDEK